MPSLYRPLGNGCADRVPIFGVTFLRIATTNKPGAINPSNFYLLGFTFQEIITLVCSIICMQVYQMVAALTTVTWWFGNGLRLRHVVSSASRRRRPNRRKSARVISLLVVLPYRRVRLPRGLRHRRESSTSSSVRRAGHIFFYYSLCINYLLCNIFYHYYYYLQFALFLCTGK